MNEGRITFRVTKVGFAVNSKWKVLLDGKIVGNIDFKESLQLMVPKGKHRVQYKVGFQATKEMWIDVGDDEVIVECVWDGTVRNFYVMGGGQKTNINIKENIQNSEYITNTNDQSQGDFQTTISGTVSDNRGNEKKSKAWIIAIVVAVIVICIIGSMEEEEEEEKNDTNSHFGITKEQYFNNLKKVSNAKIEFDFEKTLDNGCTAYAYNNGNRQIVIYTDSKGYVYSVRFVSGGIIYGIGLISETMLGIATDFFMATGVEESESKIYSALYKCVDSGDGSYVTLDNCEIIYSESHIQYSEVVQIDAK